MKWAVLTPYLQTRQKPWITDGLKGHQYNVIPAAYCHGDGFLTAFSPLATTTGALRRLGGVAGPLVAWTFNLGALQGGLKHRLARQALRAVDVLVVHSRQEIEAMMFGRAKVVTRCPGTLDSAEDGKHALRVLPGDASALADRIEALWPANAWRARLGLAAAAHVQAEFSEQAEARHLQRGLDRFAPP